MRVGGPLNAATLPGLRSYRVTIETASGVANDEEVVRQALAALRRMPAVLDPTATRDAEGVLSASFTLHAPALDAAQTIAGQLFSHALGEAGLGSRALWRIIEADEGPPVDEQR